MSRVPARLPANRANRAEPERHTVSGELLVGIITCAQACGIPGHRLHVGKGGPDPRGRYGGFVLERIWSQITRSTDDPLIGHHMAQASSLTTFGLLASVLRRSTCLLDALLQMESYSIVMYQGTKVRIRQTSDTVMVELEIGPLSQATGWQSNLWVLTNIGLLPQKCGLYGVKPVMVACGWPNPGDCIVNELNQLWPWVFGASAESVTFDLEEAKRPFVSADRKLTGLWQSRISRQLEELPKDGTLSASLAAILRALSYGRIPSIYEAADQLGLSARTLQRRLGAEGRSFQLVLADVQHSLADEYLGKQHLSQREVALLLGYSDVAGFSRAYKQWTGHAPGQNRRD